MVALEGSLYVTGGAILEDGDGIELVQRSVRTRITIPAIRKRSGKPGFRIRNPDSGRPR